VPNEEKKSLEKQIDTRDRGDDIQRRFRYQNTCAAIFSLKLLDEEPEFIEMYCEHYEDILIKKHDNKFVGIQVKTRKKQKPFKTIDPPVKVSLKRFFKLEKSHGQKFSRYVLYTNVGFWQERKNHNNLDYLINKIRDSNSISILQEKEFSKIVELTNEIDDLENETIFRALKKLYLEPGPRFEDIKYRLANDLTQYPRLSDKTFSELDELSSRLVYKMYEASSMSYIDPKHDYFFLSEDPKSSANAEILNGKRITKETLMSIIQDFNLEYVPLQTLDPIVLKSLRPGRYRKLEIKMIAGEIPLASINLIKEHKYSAEALFQKLLHKNQKKAQKLFDSLSLIAKTECQEAYDANFSKEKPFGHGMLQESRCRIRHRYELDCCRMFNGTYEHMMGIAGILTEECKIWWSAKFNIPEESQ